MGWMQPSTVAEDMAVNRARPTVTSAPLTDEYERISREQSSGEMGSPQLSSEELIGIEKSSEQQVKHLENLHNDLQELKRLLQSNSQVGDFTPGGLPSKTVPKPRGTTNFGKWQFGRGNNNAAQQVLNDGMT
jgi:hypothetical protein